MFTYVPRFPTVTLSPRGPIDAESPERLTFNRKPARSRSLRRNRKLTRAHPRRSCQQSRVVLLGEHRQRYIIKVGEPEDEVEKLRQYIDVSSIGWTLQKVGSPRHSSIVGRFCAIA